MLFLPFVYLHHAPQKWAAEMHVHDLIWKMKMRTDCPLKRSIGLVSARAASHFPIWIWTRMEPLLGHSESGMYFDKSVRAAHKIGLKLSGPLEDPLRSYGCCNTNISNATKNYFSWFDQNRSYSVLCNAQYFIYICSLRPCICMRYLEVVFFLLLLLLLWPLLLLSFYYNSYSAFILLLLLPSPMLLLS